MQPLASSNLSGKQFQFQRSLRFLIVGLSSSLAYIGTMSLAASNMHVPVVAATVAAFIVATTISYGGNTLWTFKARFGSRSLVRFWTVTFVGLYFNIIFVWVLNAA